MRRNTTSTNHDDFIVAQLKKDGRFLEAYLNEALSDENENPRVVQDMLRKVAQAAALNRHILYKTFSDKGNLGFFSVTKIVNALGFHFKLVRNKRRMAVAK